VNLKQVIGSVAIAGVLAASSLGIGAGVANADWHGYYDHGRGWHHDYYRGGWPVDRWWHPWGVPWHW